MIFIAKKKGFNNYKIVDDYVIIYLEERTGQIYETYIDLEDLEKVKALNVRWHKRAKLDYTDNTYAMCTFNLGKIDGKYKNKTLYLHQFVLGIKDQSQGVVDHINHNPLDNRKSNLRITQQVKNTKNRNTKNKNNTSGYRNVSWDGHKWVVQLQIEGKHVFLKRFLPNELEEAAKYAEEMRNKYYGEFAGNN